jgi:hypothetical protein
MKFKLLQSLLIAIVLMAATARLSAGEYGAYEPRHGDVVFQSLGNSPLIDMIEGSTHSGYSHCGMVVQKDGKWLVIEAVGPVREIPLREWIHNGRKDGYAAYRLKPSYSARANDFVKAAYDFIGKPYDIHYQLDDEKIYCSELVYKAFHKATGEDLGKLMKLKDLNWKPYEGVIKQIEGGNVPLDREIITPVAVSRAAQLECVYMRDITASTGDN